MKSHNLDLATQNALTQRAKQISRLLNIRFLFIPIFVRESIDEQLIVYFLM